MGPSTSSKTSARTPSDIFKPVNVRDVWVIQRGEHLGLTLEPGQAIGGHSVKSSETTFKRAIALELRIPRAIDLAHAAGAESRREISYGPDTGTGDKAA